MTMEPRPTKRARGVLTEQRAYDIAVAASTPLRGRVRLVATKRDLERVGRYEWIELAVPLPEKKPYRSLEAALNWVVQARDACLVWHMLACCRGFQGHENDTFWKKLIDHVGRKDDDDDAMDDDEDEDEHDEVEEDRVWWGSTEPVTDAHTFFRTWEPKKTTFPRFRLHVPFSRYFDPDGYDIDDNDLDIETADDWIQSVVRTFIGLSNAFTSDAVRKTKTELVEFIDVTRYAHVPVEIGVHLGNAYILDDLADTIRDLVADIETDTLASKQEEQSPWHVLGRSRFPLVKLTELCPSLREAITSDDALNELTDMLRSGTVAIPEVAIAPNEESMGEQALTDFVNALSRFRRDGAAGVDTLVLYLGDAEQWQVELLFSAIPITGIETLRIFGNSRDFGERGLTMDHHTWTWLAYAVYHPWLFSTSIHLDLEFLDISEHSAGAMRGALATQRCLYRLVYGEEDDSLPAEDNEDFHMGRYAIVSVRQGAKCYEDASLTGGYVRKLSHAMDLTAVIQFDTVEIKSLPPTLCVVYPGKGPVWIARADVTTLERPYAEFAHLDGLRLGRPYANMTMEMSDLHALVYQLTTLDIGRWGKMDAARLLGVLRACCAVKALRVEHTGELFHEWTEDTPAVDEDGVLWELALTRLDLVWYGDNATIKAPSPAAWQGVLRDLSTLTIETSGLRRDYLPSVRQLFQDAYRVERFVWKTGSWGDYKIEYTAKRQQTRELLGIADGRFDTARHALGAAAKRAFASVIKRKAAERDAQNARGLRSRKASAVGLLSHDVARLICEFATVDVPRVAWVDDR